MKRKTLISIALIIIMLLNCMMPIFQVNAATDNEIQLNGKLYDAVKKNLLSQGIRFSANNVTHTLAIESDVLSSITRLELNNSGISNLEGIEKFSGLTSLELSGNDLDKDSLEPLSKLTNLIHLDLSTNHIEDVTAIKSLVDTLKNKKGGIILSGQTVDIVQSVWINDEEDSDNNTTTDFELPPILEYAGYIKSNWKSVSTIRQQYNIKAPELDITKVPMYITSETKTVPVTIYDDSTASGYYGLVKLTIYINDDEHEASLSSNKNPAATNLLNGCKFNLYFVVYPKSAEAITTMDSSLYEAIKEQLTANQTINPQLPSYQYAVDSEGNVIYDSYLYSEFENYRILSKFNSEDPTDKSDVRYLYNTAENKLYKLIGTIPNGLISQDEIIAEIKKRVELVENPMIQEAVLRTVDAQTGEIMEYAGYKVASDGTETNYRAGKTLYIQAYDEAKTFVINDEVLTNDITSLILNNKRIKDLSGIEKFVGLSSNLNISHNFLDSIESLSELQMQKDNWEKQIQELYNKWLKNREYGNLSTSMNQINTEYSNIEENIKEIKKAYDTLKEGKAEDATKNEETYNKAVWGYTDENGKKVEGYVDKIRTSVKTINNEINLTYLYLNALYDCFEDEYKLTSLLADDINYTTYEEYKEYSAKTTETTEGATKDTAQALFSSQISRIKTLESSKGLSKLDKELLEKAKEKMPVFFEEKEGTETPISDYYNEYLSKVELSRSGYVKNINIFRKISIYSEMANYCLLKRMNESVPTSDYCYEEEYLKKRIEELEEEDIPADLEKEILTSIQENKTDNEFFDIYKKYENSRADLNDKMIYMGLGEYLEVYKEDDTINTGMLSLSTSVDEGVAHSIISTVDLFENAKIGNENIKSDSNSLDLYNQLISISNKLVQGNVEKFVTLPDLKVIDVSYNAELEDISVLSKLENLRELNASYCYIADITNIDWASMKYLRKLSLAYNFISDITSILSVPELKYLDLSNNLLSGKLPITEQQYEVLFKELEELNLSGNQINDIENLLIYIDHISGGNYSDYLAREDTLNIDLSKQNLEINITDPIYLSDYPTTIDIDLPPIFTQLLALDAARVGFGENSQNGRIESEGTYVTLNTRTLGDKEGNVVVLPMSGNGENYDTCLGNGTTAKIKYTVSQRSVKSITITPSEDVKAKNGDKVQFTAEIEGENLNNKVINWSIKGNTSENTKIDSTGLLEIGADEKSEAITVIATSDFDSSVSEDVEVLLPDNKTTDPENPGETTDPENPGGTTDPENPGGTIDPENPGGTTDPDEIVRETVNTKELGYDKDEEFVKGIKAQTPISDFKTILLNGKEYNVVVTKDGKEVTTGNMTTGMYVKVQDSKGNEVKDENGHLVVYQVVVKGDVNGDGVANSLDSNIIKAYRNDVVKLEGAEKAAADINNDGNVNITDSKLLLYHRAEVKNYSLDYQK